jgi:undecaprenyl diphosphate synthase
MVETCGELGIQVLTLYTFSTENWRRPIEEVSALMKLLISTLRKEIDDLLKNNVQLMTIGDLTRLPKEVANELEDGIKLTEKNTGLILNLALNYGAREEIVNAVKAIAHTVQTGVLEPDKIDNQIINKHLYTASLPDPDLLIRTSGELRLSNFLLWQLAYTELFITDVFWPDFNRHYLYEAISAFQERERRFGRVSEQLDNPL